MAGDWGVGHFDPCTVQPVDDRVLPSSLKRGRNVIIVAFCDGSCIFLSSLTASHPFWKLDTLGKHQPGRNILVAHDVGCPRSRGDDEWARWQERELANRPRQPWDDGDGLPDRGMWEPTAASGCRWALPLLILILPSSCTPSFLLCIIIPRWKVNAACLLRLGGKAVPITPSPLPHSSVTQLETSALRVLCWLSVWVSSVYWLLVLAVILQFDSEIVRQDYPWPAAGSPRC